MAQFSSLTFLPKPTSTQNYLKIRDVLGVIRYKIYNNSLTARYVEGSNLVLKVESDDKLIKLDFENKEDAKAALLQIVSNYNTIRKTFSDKNSPHFKDTEFSIFNSVNKDIEVKFLTNNLTMPRTYILPDDDDILALDKNILKNDENNFYLYEDFINNVYSIPDITINGTNGTINTSTSTSEEVGVIEWNVYQVNDRIAFKGLNNLIVSNQFRIDAKVKINQLPNGVDNYRFMIGFLDNKNFLNVENAILWLFDYATNANNLLTYTENSTSGTTNVSSVLDTSFNIYTIIATSNVILFQLNGVTIHTETSNIPINPLSYGISFEKLAGTNGVSLEIDYVKVRLNIR